MLYLRLAGISFGFLILLYIWIKKSGYKRLSNLDLLIAHFVAISLITLGFYPDILNSLLQFFSFDKGGGKRIIGLLVFSSFIIYILFLLLLSRTRELEQNIDRLVIELAKKEFRNVYKKTDSKTAPIYIIIPAYNEEESIGDVLQRIPEKVHGLNTKTLVVVDGSTDATENIVKNLDKAAISHVINRGGGSALKAGYQVAFEDGAEYVVTMDADGQHLPEEIPNVIKPIIDGHADFVNGSRILGNYEKQSHIRSFGVLSFNWLISILMMRRITDASNSFRAIRMIEYPKLDLRQSQYHSSEMLIEALKKGLRVIEIPITVKKRISGESKKGTTLRYALGFTRAIILTWLR